MFNYFSTPELHRSEQMIRNWNLFGTKHKPIAYCEQITDFESTPQKSVEDAA